MLSVIRKIWLWSWKSKWSCFFLVSFFFQGLSDMCTPTQYMSVSCCRLWSHDSRTDVTGRWQGRVDPWRRLRHHKYLWCHWGMCSSSAWRWGMCLCLNFFLSLSLFFFLTVRVPVFVVDCCFLTRDFICQYLWARLILFSFQIAHFVLRGCCPQ